MAIIARKQIPPKIPPIKAPLSVECMPKQKKIMFLMSSFPFFIHINVTSIQHACTKYKDDSNETLQEQYYWEQKSMATPWPIQRNQETMLNEYFRIS